jgi:hypothetical protein
MPEELKTQVHIGGETAGLKASFVEAGAIVREQSAQMVESLQAVRESVESVTSTFSLLGGGLLAVLGLGELSKQMTESASSVRLLALAMGSSVEDASVLKSALNTIGASSETFTGALDHLARQIKQNEQGINDLGIATRNADGTTRDAQTVMLEALRAVQQYKPGLDQAQAAMYLFGRSVADVRTLMPLLNVSMDETKAKAQALGLVLSEEDVAATNRYKVALNESKEVVEAVFTAIGRELLPVLTQMAKAFADSGPQIVAFAHNLGDFLGGAIKVVATAFDYLTGIIRTWTVYIAEAGTIAYDAIRGDWSKVRADWKAGLDSLADISRETKEKIVAIWAEPAKGAEATDPLAVAKGGKKAFTAPEKGADLAGRDAILRAQLAGEIAITKEYVSEQDKELQRGYRDGLVALKDYYDRRLALAQIELGKEIAVAERLKTSVAEQKAAAAKAGDEKAVQAAEAELVKIENQLIVLRMKRSEIVKTSAAEEADAEKKLANEIAKARFAAEEKMKIDALEAQHAIISAEANAGQISGAQAIETFRAIEKQKYDIAVEYATKRAALEADQVKAQADLQAKLAGIFADYQKKDTEIAVQNIKQRKDLETQVIQDMQNDFATALDQIEARHKKLIDVISGFFSSLQAQMLKLANQEIAQSLFGARPTAGSAGGAGGGGLLSGLFSSLLPNLGNLFGPQGAEAAAAAGVFQSGTPWVPKTALYMLHAGERVIPRQENIEGGGAPITVTNHFNVPAETSYESRAAIASQIGRTLQSARRNF